MKNEKLSEELSRRLGYTLKDTSYLLNVVTSVIVKEVQEGNCVSIEEVGTFSSEKKLEEFVDDPVQGKILMPPRMVVKYEPSQMLVKSLTKRLK